MNIKDLKQNLIFLGVDPRNYTLNGPPYKDSSWVLESDFDIIKFTKIWHVFNFERGKRYDENVFDTEDEACRYLFEKLRKHKELFDKIKSKS